MKYIFFGGAFDPVHVDHISKAQQVLDATGCPTLFYMPTYKHVWGKRMEDPGHRRQMLIRAIKDSGDDRLWINMYEVARKVEGSTIDVLKGLFKEQIFCGDATPENSAYLIGMDQALAMDKWIMWEELIEFIPFIVMSRHNVFGHNDHYIAKGDEWFLKPPHKYIRVEGIGASSSIIRYSIRNRLLNPEYLTPSTLAYIKEHELYV